MGFILRRKVTENLVRLWQNKLLKDLGKNRKNNSNAVQKVCPVVFRKQNGKREILAFRHPFAGLQLVKGTIEKGEVVKDAALRELAEESGINEVSSIEFKATWHVEKENQIWHFYFCEVETNLPETWNFFTSDDGGLNFEFFWFDLTEKPCNEWHSVYQNALEFIKKLLIQDEK
jgi:ADP-ribose pyrophosphatase YjhB (NUDIX family)